MIQNILITGATSGLGYALAKKFIDLGYKVYGVGRNKEKLKELSNYSENIVPICADINEAEDRNAICNAIVADEPISIIHSAAAADPSVLEDITEEELMRSFNTNCISPTMLTKELLPHLAQGQRILNISSGAASMPLSGLSAYCGTKAAFQMMINCFNIDLNAKQIFCGNVRPGMVDTPLQKRWRETNRFFPNKDFYVNAQQNNELIQPEVAAEFVSWVLLKTDDEAFKNTEWNIYEESYQPDWLERDSLYHREGLSCSM